MVQEIGPVKIWGVRGVITIADHWKIGDRIEGHWEIVKWLGEGGMGVLYGVYDHELGCLMR